MKQITQDQLDKMIEQHNNFHEDSCIFDPVDFSCHVYEGLTFKNARLTDANFTDSIIRNCKFVNCSLPIASYWDNSGFSEVMGLVNCEFIDCDATDIIPIKGHFNKIKLNEVNVVYSNNSIWVSNDNDYETFMCHLNMLIKHDLDEEIPEWFIRVKGAIVKYIEDNPLT